MLIIGLSLLWLCCIVAPIIFEKSSVFILLVADLLLYIKLPPDFRLSSNNRAAGIRGFGRFKGPRGEGGGVNRGTGGGIRLAVRLPLSWTGPLKLPSWRGGEAIPSARLLVSRRHLALPNRIAPNPYCTLLIKGVWRQQRRSGFPSERLSSRTLAPSHPNLHLHLPETPL